MTDNALDREALLAFEALLEQPEAEREAWFAALELERPDVAGRVAAMRLAGERADLKTGAAVDAAEEEPDPERIGAYRIVGRIGRGGMGSVYRGQRATGDFDHAVAIKVIKPGLLSEALIERFQRERNTLAQLSHPNIAQLYDGGETETGSPYIVMELVDGLPLLQWTEQQDVGRAKRQNLFLDICNAVAAAHRSLIVHRDLTPSNVLVTQAGVVKLIDFGIARPIEDEDSGGVSPRRGSSNLSLTPGFAAPERMSGGAVTTAADIYSLGKLLEKLLPPAADSELKAIIARATATDPHDRYPTTDALAADVAAWRDNMPVAAVGGGRHYAVGKFVARHRLGVATASLGLFLLVGALAIAVVAYGRAETARKAEQARFDELRRLANYMLFDLNGRMERVAGNTTARSELAARAQTYLSALADSPDADPDLRLEAARGFNQLARIQGLPTEPNLGQREEARASLQRAEQLLRDLPAGYSGAAVPLALNRTYSAMIALHGDADQEAAARLMQEAVTTLDAVPAGERAQSWRAAQAEVRHGQAELLLLFGKIEEMPALADRLTAEVDAWPEAERASQAAEFERAYADMVRGQSLNNGGQEAAALPVLRAAEQRLKRLDAASPNDPIFLNTLAWTAYEGYAAGSTADPAESARFLALARQAVDRLVALEGEDQSLRSLAVNVRQAQAEALGQNGRFADALALQREVIAGRRAAIARTRDVRSLSRLGMSSLIFGNIALRAGNRVLACNGYRESSAAFRSARAIGPLLGRSAAFEAGVNRNLGLCNGSGGLSPVE